VVLCSLLGPEGHRRHGRIPDSIRPLLDKPFRDVPKRVAEHGVRVWCKGRGELSKISGHGDLEMLSRVYCRETAEDIAARL
jgi:hypothetical protein